MQKFRPSVAAIITYITLIVIGLGVRWYFNNFDKQYYSKDYGYSEEARRNPFLAAQLYLKANDIEFEAHSNYKLFDDVNRSAIGQYDSIFIHSSRVGMSSTTRENMKNWARKGGHLVLLATEVYDYEFESSRDVFLDELGVRFYESDYVDASEEEKTAELTFNGYEQSSKVYFDTSAYIEDTSGDAAFIAGTEYADQLLQYDYGEGLITVVVDFDIWKNNRIDHHDHAMFLSQLIGRGTKAWLLYNRVQPTLFSMAVQNAPLIVISAVALLLVIFFSNLWRVGPKKADDLRVNREIMQHIEAAAQFNYRRDKGELLVNEMMQTIHHRFSQLNYGYSRLTPIKQLEKISHVTGIEINSLKPLLDEQNESHEQFINKAKLVQQIRKHL
ncbi:MAG: DUF4350 domain-containing protein [Kangiellaceae bacterium]|nr:DUF4350 domain-containing protein [Kangiellaceae bacterium]MCW9015550.1 DUF4350 domain-containing protein [Kangiellaceae bacterium]